MSNLKIADLLDLSGQVAIVTGASRGIGSAIARTFVQAGARVAMVARSAEQLERVAAELREIYCAGRPEAVTGEDEDRGVFTFGADVADKEQVKQVVARTVEVWGRIDILVNNAGILQPATIEQIDLLDWQRMLDINLTGAYLCTREVVPFMKKSGRGRIINIASISAQTGGVSGGAHYAASKGGMISMTKTLARDLAPYGITANAIAPGVIDSNPERLAQEAREKAASTIPLGRLGAPEDVAYAALFLGSRMGAYITGTTLDVNGGALKR